MKQKLKRFLRFVSLLCFGITLALWTMGFCGYGFVIATPPIFKQAVATWFVGGGVVLGVGKVGSGSDQDGILGFQFRGGKTDEPTIARPFVLPSFDPLHLPNGVPTILLPYWLLLIAFGAAPAMHIWGNIKAKREKKLFEQAVASKRAELEKTANAKQLTPPPEN